MSNQIRMKSILGVVSALLWLNAGHPGPRPEFLVRQQEPAAFAAGVKRKDSAEDPIITDSQTVSFHPGQFLHLVTARFLGQERNLLENQAAVDQRDTAQVLFDAPIVGKGMHRLDEMVSL